MRDRVPAQALIEQVLLRQAAERPPTRLDRLVGRDPLAAQARPWFAGAVGERAVAAVLATLPAGWTTLHSLPVGRRGADIDHLVVGPAGVFTISTTGHPAAAVRVAGRTVLVAGARQPSVPKAEAEARRVDRIVAAVMPDAPAVRPVVAVVGARRLTVKRGPEPVAVLEAARLRRFLLSQPVRITPAQADALVAVLDEPRSWRPAAAAGPELLLAYRVLGRRIAAAERIRRTWAALGGVAISGSVLAAMWTGPTLLEALLH